MQIPKELVEKYLSRKTEELSNVKKYVSEKNYEELKNIGHKFKGSAATFGFPELSEIGSRVERAAIKKDDGELTKLLNSFESWVADKVISKT